MIDYNEEYIINATNGFYEKITGWELCSKYYFISDKKFSKSTTVNPRVPYNYFTQNLYEDNTSKRICLCDSINKCLLALSKNLKDTDLYVYTIHKRSNIDPRYGIFRPNIEFVPDIELTNEIWILDSIKLKYNYKIHIIDSGKSHIYKYGADKITNAIPIITKDFLKYNYNRKYSKLQLLKTGTKYSAETYEWNYEKCER